jgi:hypothetical protein
MGATSIVGTPDPLDEGEIQKALPDMIEEQIIRGFAEELTREDYEESLKEVEESLK